MGYNFILLDPIDNFDLISQSNISIFQIQTWNVSSSLGSNHTPRIKPDTQKVHKSKDTIEPSNFKDISHVVENYDY